MCVEYLGPSPASPRIEIARDILIHGDTIKPGGVELACKMKVKRFPIAQQVIDWYSGLTDCGLEELGISGTRGKIERTIQDPTVIRDLDGEHCFYKETILLDRENIYSVTKIVIYEALPLQLAETPVGKAFLSLSTREWMILEREEKTAAIVRYFGSRGLLYDEMHVHLDMSQPTHQVLLQNLQRVRSRVYPVK